MKNWKILLVVVLAAASTILYLQITNSLEISNTTLSDSKPKATLAPLKAQHSSSQHSDDEMEAILTSSEDDLDIFESQLIEKLQSTYGARIDALNVQASLITVKRYVLKYDPQQGLERFSRIIHAAFPKYAESILSIIERLEIYNDWIIENQTMLTELTEAMQQGTIWEKRRELFGEDAEEIWADELAELSQKQTKMHELFDEMDKSKSATIDETLYQLKTALAENHQGSIQELAVSGGNIAKVLFNFESVQEVLKSLSPEERQLEINKVRRELGFSEEQIAKQQEKDERRNKQWDNGLAYMNERSVLLETTSEADLPEAMKRLRDQYFGKDAVTIQKEEDSDFWRFKRPRKYGNN